MKRIGLTGGIAAGKSTVARHLKDLGAKIIDYDLLARKVVEPGSPGLRAIVDLFGSEAEDSQGQMNRSWLASQVFGPGSPTAARQRLNAIEHPLIFQLAQQEEARLREEEPGGVARSQLAGWPGKDAGHEFSASAGQCAERTAESSGNLVVVHDVPLLVEVMDVIPFVFDHIVSVEAPTAVRMQRLTKERAMSHEQAMARIADQASQGERLRLADVVIDSTKPIEQMFASLDKLYAQWADLN